MGDSEELSRSITFSPFETEEVLHQRLRQHEAKGIRAMVLTLPENSPLSTAAFMRMASEHGTGEIGTVISEGRAQRSRPRTKANDLMLRHAVEAFGWRCV